MLVLKSRHRAILIVILAVVAATVLAWFARTDPAINYLPHYRDADWIVFPSAADARAHWSASLDTTFRSEFALPAKPASGRLRLCAMRRAEVKINGVSISLPQKGNWKNISDVGVVEQLREGTNLVEARVFNDSGPPALWLVVSTDELNVCTGVNWNASIAGSSWRNAALASAPRTPGRGNPVASGEQTVDAAKRTWPLWIVLIGIAWAGVFLWRASSEHLRSVSLERLAIVLVCATWLLLCWNNTRLLPFHAGFDSKEHLRYIDHVQQHWSVPSAGEGWEMYQPPLYYFVATSILSLFKLSISDPGSVVVLRGLGAFFGITQFVLVFLSLRLLLPVRAALLGALMAACLPMHVYLMHYVTNELLTATLATLTVYLCLRLLGKQAPRAAQYVLVGLALGATLLAKSTGLLLLAVVIAAIWSRLIYTKAPVMIWLRNFGLLIATCLAVSGWYYAFTWLKFGTPLIGNWDAISGFAWWQDPGYHSSADYLRFGRSLITPLFGGFAGFWDGIYSTAWGDGLSGGASAVNVAWNMQPMISGYLWAMVPAFLILVGAGVAIVRFLRQPSAKLFLLLALPSVIALGLGFMTLKVPSYAQAKAFYGLSGVTSLCFFGAVGWETLTCRLPRFGLVIGTLLIAWALNSLATFWIIPSVGQHLYAVRILGQQGDIGQADAEAGKAVEVDPANSGAHGYRALSLSELGDDTGAVNEAERAIELAPTDSAAHLNLAIAAKRTDIERAIGEARYAIELGPENFSAYQLLMKCLLESGRYHEAAALGPRWLMLSPFDVEAHSSVVVAMARTGELATAARQLGYVMVLRPSAEDALAQLQQIMLSLAEAADGLQRLRDIAANAPDAPRMLDEIAWFLATYPDSNLRDGAEAVRLAERACKLTDRRVPALLATLAAAYAEMGDFSRAVASAEEALNTGRSLNDTDSVRLSEKILSSVRANLPVRHAPEG